MLLSVHCVSNCFCKNVDQNELITPCLHSSKYSSYYILLILKFSTQDVLYNFPPIFMSAGLFIALNDSNYANPPPNAVHLINIKNNIQHTIFWLCQLP